MEVFVKDAPADVPDQVVLAYWFDMYGDTCNTYVTEGYGENVCELILPRSGSAGVGGQGAGAETRFGGSVDFDVAIGAWDLSPTYCNASSSHTLDVRPVDTGTTLTGIMVVPRIDIEGAERDGWTFRATPGTPLSVLLTSDPYFKGGQVPQLIVDGPGVSTTITSDNGVTAGAVLTPAAPGTYALQAVDYTPVGANWDPRWGVNTVRGDYELVVKYGTETGSLTIDGAARPAPGTYLAETRQALHVALEDLPEAATGQVQFTLSNELGAQIALESNGEVSLTAGMPAALPLPGELTPGTYAISAAYSGDDDHFGSDYAATLTISPGAVTPEFVVEGAEPGSEAGAPFTAPYASDLALVLSGLPAEAEASIQFRVERADGAEIDLADAGQATLENGTARLPLPPLGSGRYTLSAVFPGTSLLSASTSTATLEIEQIPVNPVMRVEGARDGIGDEGFVALDSSPIGLVLEALPEDTDGTVSFQVQQADGSFIRLPGGAELPVDAAGTASVEIPSLEPGAYFVTAAFSGDDNFLPATVNGRLTIEPAPKEGDDEEPELIPTEVRLALTGAKTGRDGTGLIATFGARLELTLSGVPFDATGEVSFFGVTAEGALVPLDPESSVPGDRDGVFSMTLPTLSVGAYRLTGRFNGDDVYAASEDTLELTITPHPIQGSLDIVASDEARRADVVAAEGRMTDRFAASEVRIITFGAPVPVRFESVGAPATGTISLRVLAGEDATPLQELGPVSLDAQGSAVFNVETETSVSRYRLEPSLTSEDFEMTNAPSLDLLSRPSSLFAERSAAVQGILLDHLKSALRTELRRRDGMMQDVRRRLDCDRTRAEAPTGEDCGFVNPVQEDRAFDISTPLGGFDARALGFPRLGGLDGTLHLEPGLLRMNAGAETVELLGDRTSRLSGQFRFDQSSGRAARGQADGKAEIGWRKDGWRTLVRLSAETEMADKGLTASTFDSLAQAETRGRGAAILGAFGSLNFRRDDVERNMQGDIESHGGSVGLYGIQRLGPKLTLDAYVQLGWTQHRLDVSDDLLAVTGNFDTRHWLSGATLAGIHEGLGYVWRPRVTASHARAHAGTIELDAEAWTLTDAVDLAIGNVVLTDVTAASQFDIRLDLGDRLTVKPALSVAPNLGYQAWDLPNGDHETGTAGIDVDLRSAFPPNGSFSVRTSVDATRDRTRTAVSVQIQLGF